MTDLKPPLRESEFEMRTDFVPLKDSDSGKWVWGSPDGGIDSRSILFDTKSEAQAVANWLNKELTEISQYRFYQETWKNGALQNIKTRSQSRRERIGWLILNTIAAIVIAIIVGSLLVSVALLLVWPWLGW